MSRPVKASAAATGATASAEAATRRAGLTPAGRKPSPRPASAADDDPAESTESESASAQADSKKAPQTRLQEKKLRKNHRSVRTGQVAAATFAVIVFLLTGGAWGMKTWFNAQFNQIAALDENSEDIRNAAGQRGDENFLIAGSDTRAGAEAEEGVGSANGVPGARSDSLMIAHIPADRRRAVVVGFPRDLEVTRPECERWDSASGNYTGEVVPAKEKAKLNEAYAIGGPQCTTKLVQQLTGMRMNHFVGVDFHGFKEMIDVVEGVPLHLEEPVIDDVLGPIIPEAGDVTISGDQALNYVRARHVEGDVTSDYGRIKRQQQVIGSLLQKTMSKEVILNPGKLTGMVNAFAAATFGENLGVDQMLTLAQSMEGLDSSKVQFQTVPTTGEANTRGNEVLLEEDGAQLFRALIENGPLPSEVAAQQAAKPVDSAVQPAP